MFCVDFLEGNMERLFTWGICETAALENYSQKCLNKNQREELLHYFDVRRRQKYISEAEPFLNKDGDTKDIWFDSLVQLMAQVGLKISTLQKDFEDSNDLGEETFSESIAGNEGNMQAFSQALQMLLILCYKPKMIFGKNEEEFLEKVRKCKIELGNNGNIREYKEALACVYRGSTTDKKMDIQSAANILNKYVIGQQPRNIFDVDIRKELQEEMCAKNNWENTLSICEQIFSSNDNGELNRHLIELEMADKVIRIAKEVIIQEATVLMVKGVWILLQEEIRGCSLEVSELEYEDDMLSADHEGIIDDRDPEEIPNNNERYIERNQKNKEKSFEKKREENFLKHYTGF